MNVNYDLSRDLIICPGFGSTSNLFLSFCSMTMVDDDKNKTVFHMICYYSFGEWLIFDFLYNRFWIKNTSSGVVGLLISQAINDNISNRKTSAVQGPEQTLFNKRDIEKYNLLLDNEQINILKNINHISTNQPTIQPINN